MSDGDERARPILSKYEVEIPGRPAHGELRYDEEAMVLTANGHPAAREPAAPIPPGTRITRVRQETTDDD